MTLHQLTHSVGYEFDLDLGAAPRRALATAVAALRRWLARNRLEREMHSLDHREIADLAFRR